MSDIDYSNVSGGKYDISYRDFIDLWPYEVVHHERSGSYQGSHLYLVAREMEHGKTRYAFFDIAFGSCTGCDFIRSVLGFDDEPMGDPEKVEKIEQFFERKRKGLVWHDADVMAEKLQDEDETCMGHGWRDDFDRSDFVEALEAYDG